MHGWIRVRLTYDRLGIMNDGCSHPIWAIIIVAHVFFLYLYTVNLDVHHIIRIYIGGMNIFRQAVRHTFASMGNILLCNDVLVFVTKHP